MTPSPQSTTWVACLTPPGQGALATLALHGPAAWDVVRQLFRPRSGGQLPPTPTPGQFWLGRLGEDVADEVVVAVKGVEPVPALEVHGHGGREVVRLGLDLFRSRGLEVCTWEDFLRHTSADALRAKAAVALAQAPTARTAAVLLDQHEGTLGRKLDEVLAALDSGDVGAAREVLGELARHAALGRHLTVPWRVAVAGAPNVGKSSLVNALAGYQRSVVAAMPGTTRDVVTARLAVEGWPVELADTAGLRPVPGACEVGVLEEEGMRLARSAAATADLCLWVLDASAEPVWPGEEGDAVRLVVNKVDLAPAWDLDRAQGAVRVSARTGAGVADLCAALGRWLVPNPPPAGAAVPFTEHLAAGVDEALRHLEEGRVEEARRVLDSVCQGG